MVQSKIYKFNNGILIKYFNNGLEYYKVWKDSKLSKKYTHVGNAMNYLDK